jgi:hypothetical protein
MRSAHVTIVTAVFMVLLLGAPAAAQETSGGKRATPAPRSI